MGIAWLLLRRTFAARPKRTLLFLAGYALATAVMVTLLAVGQAVLLQAQDKDLLGGGDLIIVPQGIDVESLKVGGVQAMYYTIPQARFITRQVLGSTRFRDDIETVSPYLFSRLLYGRKKGAEKILPLYAQGALPDQEKHLRKGEPGWSNSREDNQYLHPDISAFYHDIDRFHLPDSPNLDMTRWAEWHYFNFEGAGFYGYCSIMVAGDILQDKATWIVSLQMFDPAAKRFAAMPPAHRKQLPLERVDYDTGASRVRFDGDHYEITLNYTDKVPVRGSLRYYPKANLYLPPTYLAKSDNFESGYVIPSIRGRYEGSIQIGNRFYNFAEAKGYHDHNWGIWQQPGDAENAKTNPVSWNWGHASSDQYALFYGEIFLGGKSKGLFLGLFDNNGFLSMFRPEAIRYGELKLDESGLQVPSRLEIRQEKPFTSLHLSGISSSHVVSPVGIDTNLFFVQYKMNFELSLNLDGKEIHAPATGNAETFVAKQ